MQKLFLYILLFLMNSAINAQIQPVDSIELKSPMTEIDIDEFNIFYFIENNKTLVKIDKNEQKHHFSNQGFLSNLKVQSSLLTTVLSNQDQLLLLDRQLNPIQDPINLHNNQYVLNYVNVLDHNFLIGYDILSHKIIQINYQQEKIINSSPILTMLKLDEIIKNVIVSPQSIYLITDSNIYIFDEFLTFKRKVTFTASEQSILIGNRIIYNTPNAIFSWSPENQQHIQLHKGKINDFCANKHQLFVQTDKVVYIYKLNN